MTHKQLIQQFQLLEAMAEQLKKTSYHARVQLERLTAPAPSRGKGKSAIPPDEQAAFIAKFRKSLIKKSVV